MAEPQKKIAKLGKTIKVGKVDVQIKSLTLTERAEILDVVFSQPPSQNKRRKKN